MGMATQLAEAVVQQGSRPRSRWWALVFLALAQFMVVLDGTIVNLALPRLQLEMGISDSTRSWVVTGLRAGLRRVPAARRTHCRLLGPQADVPRGRRRLRRRVPGRRHRAAALGADRRPRAAGRVRCAAGPCCLGAADRRLSGRKGPRHGVRDFRLHHRRRRGRRRPAGRVFDRTRELALVLLRECADCRHRPLRRVVPGQ